jgi:hypothetical protein
VGSAFLRVTVIATNPKTKTNPKLETSMFQRPALAIGSLCLTLASFGLFGSPARASDYCPPCPPKVYYQTVLVYETRTIPYTVCETRYDHCGVAYHVNVTRYRTIQVPVTRRVAVYY